MNSQISKKKGNLDILDSLDSKEILKNLIISLKEKYKLSSDDILNLLIERESEEEKFPVSIFNEKISSLETIVKYLKEDLKLNYHKIALLLNRDDRTIWSTYKNSVKKFKGKLNLSSKVFIPVSVLKNRKLAVLESLVVYLKDKLNLRFSEIAIMLARDQRTVWTVYSRARKKI